jgi:hypothetical protein
MWRRGVVAKRVERVVSYVYIIFDERGVPRYVGKGTGTRILSHRKRGHYNRRMRALYKRVDDPPAIKVREGLTHREAYEIETALITAIGRGARGPLYNLTDGGDGAFGYVQSKKTRRLHSVALKGKPKSADARASMKKSAVARWTRDEDHQTLVDYHAGMTETQRAARRAKIAVATKDAMARSGASAKISDARRGKPLTEAQMAVITRTAELRRSRGPTEAEVAMVMRRIGKPNPYAVQRMNEARRARAAERRAAREAMP